MHRIRADGDVFTRLRNVGKHRLTWSDVSYCAFAVLDQGEGRRVGPVRAPEDDVGLAGAACSPSAAAVSAVTAEGPTQQSGYSAAQTDLVRDSY